MKNFSTGMLDVKENVDIKDYTTFRIGGVFRYFTVIADKKDLKIAYEFAEKQKVKVFILGGGSNVIFPDGVFDVLAIKIEIMGFEILNETNDYVDIKIGSGENWDDIVARVVEMDLSGLESLSSIPGTVGATPVQNVGAYGSEVKDTIVEVETFDIQRNTMTSFSNDDCQFGYRDSIFKKEAKGKYVITAVIYRLNKFLVKIPDYPGVKKYLIDNNINNPKLKDVRQAIIHIRSEKLPNPSSLPNVGSFFKNPIVGKNIANQIKEKYEDLTTFAVDDKKVKISAGWLIEKAELKGKSFGNISIYDKNALVLINNKNATKEDLMLAKNEIIETVYKKFDITLEQEPEIV